MDRGIRRVVVTGSECTGKTTLARELAAHFGTSWSPEYAREYAAGKGSPLTIADVDPIARGQMAGDDEAMRRATRLVVHDTDLLSTVVYARHYYDACPQWVEHAARDRRADLYLLLRPDVPWVPDSPRDRGERRDEMHALFQTTLAEFRVPFREIGGCWAERRGRAQEAIDALLGDER
jgi:NadR type nicotinamide-nucleotide adenylyltransferase